MKATVAALITGALFLLVGIACLLMPERIQTISLNYYAEHPGAGRLNPFLEWMRTPSYILSLRLVGLIALGGCVLIIIAGIRGR